MFLAFAELNRDKLIDIAASIFNNLGVNNDMALICLDDKDSCEKMVNL